MAYPGYQLGEELGPGKLREMLGRLKREPFVVSTGTTFVQADADARAAGAELAAAKVDAVLVVVTTFVPDYFLTALLDACDAPVFLWCVEREMRCISLVCGLLNTATLYNLGKHYALHAADTDEATTMEELRVFARAAMLRRRLRSSRIGCCGGKCPIMFSMSTDDYTLKRQFGLDVVPLPIEAFYQQAKAIPDREAAACWRAIRGGVGEVTAQETDGLLSARYYLAARRLVAEHRLDALSLNCFPHLKSQVCLALAKLNDDGIAAACEGDLHSTILMYLLQALSGRAAFNGDFLRLYPETNDVLFSHCGAGAFSLAASPRDVCLRCSIETNDGLAVCYATALKGPVTLLNLMLGKGELRLAAVGGTACKTDLSYEGTPLRVHFTADVKQLLQQLARCGAGHHWNAAPGNWLPEFTLLSEWLGLTCTTTPASP